MARAGRLSDPRHWLPTVPAPVPGPHVWQRRNFKKPGHWSRFRVDFCPGRRACSLGAPGVCVRRVSLSPPLNGHQQPKTVLLGATQSFPDDRSDYGVLGLMSRCGAPLHQDCLAGGYPGTEDPLPASLLMCPTPPHPLLTHVLLPLP